jgi:SPP1 family predicted phage head-tail adaptor
MSFDTLLISTCTPMVATITINTMGGQSKSYTARSTFPGRLRPLTAQEKLHADKVTAFRQYVLYSDYPNSLTTQDRVQINSRTFEVKGIRDPSEMHHHLEYDLLELE